MTSRATSPLVVADRAGDLHLFYVEAPDENGGQEGLAIYYASRIDGFWNQPVDIEFSPGGVARLSGAVIDREGYLHLAWGDDGTLYHSMAHISQTSNAANWSTDTVLVGQLPVGEMVLDESGRLHLVMVVGLFSIEYLFSDDGGASWSAPKLVDRVLDRDDFAMGSASLAVDSEGALHVAWYRTAREVDWNNWSVWYGRSSDAGNSWQVTEMAAPEYGDSGIAIDSKDNVHLLYGRGIGKPDGRWHRWSSDRGATWSEPRALYPGVEHASGLTGGFDFALDGDGRLHMVNSYGNRNGDASAWHLIWLGERWSEPELLLDTEFHAHVPRLAIAAGNELNFVAMAPRQDLSLVYLQSHSDSQAIETRAVSTMVAEAAGAGALGGEEVVLDSTPAAPRIVLSEEVRAAPPIETPFDSLLVAVGAATLMILLMILVHRRFSDRRR